MDVRRWYRRFGLEAVNLKKEPDDHIGLELAFVAHLAGRALQTLEAGDREAFQEAIQAQRDFARRHLLVWTPLWCAQMVEYAKTPFYRGLALMLRGALDELAQFLDIPMPEVRAV
jgi:TorA maturation chaperone TorD